jgi:cytoskeleton protein RodZ
MAAEAGGEGRAGIGSRLRAAREKKGLTILQAAEKIHTEPRILEALEAENFASLGAAVYAKGHMRHYAELVGESSGELIELYSHSTRAAPIQPDLTKISRAPPESDSARFGGSAVIAVVAIAILGTLWWFIKTSGEKPAPTAVQGTEQAQSAVAKTGAVAEGAEAAIAPTASVAATRTASAAAIAAAAAPGGTATGAAPPLSPTRPTPKGKLGELTLKFSSDSWAEVYDASGQRLFYDVGAASSAHTVKGPAPMRVVLGNASGVALEYNGRAASIPAAVLPDGSVRFVINTRGRTVAVTDGE